MYKRQGGEGPGRSDKGKRTICGRHEPARECNPLHFIGRQQGFWCATRQHRLKLPGEVDRIPDPGIHSLTADRAVNMGGIPEQERAALAEVRRDPVMYVIGRKPVDLFHFQLEVCLLYTSRCV